MIRFRRNTNDGKRPEGECPTERPAPTRYADRHLPSLITVDLSAEDILAACKARGVWMEPLFGTWHIKYAANAGRLLQAEEIVVLNQRRTDLYALLTGEAPEYGLCCACGQVAITNTIHLHCLPLKGVVDHGGWGRPEAGLPFDGAVALRCETCERLDTPVVYALAAALPTPLRILIRELQDPWPPADYVAPPGMRQ